MPPGRGVPCPAPEGALGTPMRPTTTLAKSAVGSVLHAADIARAIPRRRARPAELPTAATFTIATIGHWYVADRNPYLARTIDALRRQTGVAIVTNEPESTVGGLGELGADVARFDDPSAAAAFLIARPGAIVTLRWAPP